MTSHAVRRGTKVLVAATIAAAVASIAPAHAIVGTPTALANSVPNGYSSSADAVAITYNAVIDPLQSSVTVFDVNGDPVSGSLIVPRPTEKTLIFQPSIADRFNEERSPYTATFTARARNQAAATASSVEILEFDVDFVTPFPPNVSLGDGTLPITIAGPDDAVLVTGKATDVVTETGNASGVKRVDVHFYNPLAAGSLGRSSEISAMRRTITFPCDGGCNALEELSIDIDALFDGGLPAGYWNIKVSVTDAAGNLSAQSAPMPVLRIATPA